MRRAVVIMTTVLLGVFAWGNAASAAETPPSFVITPTVPTTLPAGMHMCDPADSGGYLLPIGQPCHAHVVPVTTPTTRYCLGYAQSFPLDQPCPKPPTDLCAVHPEEFACHDPAAPPAVVDTPSTAPVVSVEPVATEVGTALVIAPQKTAQSISRAPTGLPPTGNDTLPIRVAGIALLLVGGGLILATRRFSVVR